MDTGINLPGSRLCGLEESMAAAEQTGFSHVSLSSGLTAELILGGGKSIRGFARMLGLHRLKTDWVHVPFRETHFYHPREEFRLHALTCALQSMQLAHELGAGSIVCHPINLQFESIASNCTPVETRCRLRDVFAVLLENALRLGVRVAPENLRHAASHRILAQLLEDLPQLAVCFDSGHSEITRSHQLYLGRLADRICCLHLADNFGWQDDHLPPGDGALDFAAIVKRLNQAGCRGVWGLEIIMDSSAGRWTCRDFFRYARENLMRHLKPAGQ